MWWNNGMDWGSMGGGGWVVMMVVMLAFWALVVGGVVALFRTGRSTVVKGVSDSVTTTPGPSAEDVLDGRFAPGRSTSRSTTPAARSCSPPSATDQTDRDHCGRPQRTVPDPRRKPPS